MNRSAHVTSLDAIRELRVALLEFDQEVRGTLDQLLLEQRRAEQWFAEDRPRYWPHQVRLASDAVQEARNELERCEMAIRPDERPSCLQQKKTLERAKRRQQFTEEKRDATRKWARIVKHETDEFRRHLASLRDKLDTQLPAALNRLAHFSDALDRYVESSFPATGRSSSSRSSSGPSSSEETSS